MKHFWNIAAVGLMVGLLAGCQSTDPNVGYTSRSLYPDSVSSVQVNIFSSKEFRRGLEFELAEALVKCIDFETNYRIAKDDQADSILEGQIVAIRQTVLSDTFDTDLPAEKQQQMVVNFTWKDRRSGRMLAEGRNVRVVSEYTPPIGETFFTGRQELMDKMARKIVSQMREPW